MVLIRRGPASARAEIRQKAEQLAAQINNAQAETVTNQPVMLAVSQLQSYLLGNSYITIFNPDDEHGAGDLQNRAAARQLGYYLFWCASAPRRSSPSATPQPVHCSHAYPVFSSVYIPAVSIRTQTEISVRFPIASVRVHRYLRETNVGLTLSQDEVTRRAKLAGIKHTETAWQLLDRNGDNEVTLEEVVTSVEHVRAADPLSPPSCKPNRALFSPAARRLRVQAGQRTPHARAARH